MESEDVTAKEMQAGLRGGLSLEGRRYLLLERYVDMYVTGSNSRMMARRFSHISRRARSPSGILHFLWGVPDEQADIHLRGIRRQSW